MKVYVRYGFIFTPDEVWKHKSEFEGDLGTYFGSKGYDAEIIKSSFEQSEEIMVFLKKKNSVAPLPKPPVKGAVKDMFKNVEKNAPTLKKVK